MQFFLDYMDKIIESKNRRNSFLNEKEKPKKTESNSVNLSNAILNLPITEANVNLINDGPQDEILKDYDCLANYREDLSAVAHKKLRLAVSYDVLRHVRGWTSVITIGDYKVEGIGKSKLNAKNIAAFKMLNLIKEKLGNKDTPLNEEEKDTTNPLVLSNLINPKLINF